MTRVAIIGAGTWGTTLAIMLAEKTCDINLWARSREVYNDIKENRTNKKYTSGHKIPDNLTVFLGDDIAEILKDIDVVLFAVPSHVLRGIVTFFYQSLSENSGSIRAVVNAAKGLEIGSNLRLSEVLKETLPEKLQDKIAVLSGPNIANEILNRLPGVSVVSSSNEDILDYLQPIFSTQYFRIYTNTDTAGVEVGAAVKNVIAIAAGISDGLGYGSNTKASLITRGLFELSKVGKIYGANPNTFAGVAGMGDMITTCISSHSRNRFVGQQLAVGENIDTIKRNLQMVAEGINTVKALYDIAKNTKLDLPITEAVYKIIYCNADPKESVRGLMSRKFKSEV